MDYIFIHCYIIIVYKELGDYSIFLKIDNTRYKSYNKYPIEMEDKESASNLLCH